MQVTATEAKNRFGAICANAKLEPVFVEKDGRVDTVILSLQQFEKLTSSNLVQSQKKSQFDREHRAWLSEQNARFEKQGLWCDDMRVW
jgi:hypothetical protein